MSSAFANTNELTQVVQSFLYQQAQEANQGEAEIAIEVFTPSAHFGDCENPQAFFPNANQEAAGRVSVGVRCGEQGNQVRYIQAQISIVGSYLVPINDIRAGTIITASMVTSAKGDIASMRTPPITNLTNLIGLEVRRTLRAGQPIHQEMVKAPEIIGRGDTVKIVVSGAGFQIEREGTAIDSGGLNDVIRVRIGDREILSARIIGSGRVTVEK